MTDTFTAVGIPDGVNQWPDGNVSFTVQGADFRLSNKMQSHAAYKPLVFQASEAQAPLTVTYAIGAPKRNGNGNFLDIKTVGFANGPMGAVGASTAPPQQLPPHLQQQAYQPQPAQVPQQVQQYPAPPPQETRVHPVVHVASAEDPTDRRIRASVALKAAVDSCGYIENPEDTGPYMDRVQTLTEFYDQLLAYTAVAERETT